MAIKPVTYQGVFNFKSNLYALEVKSRFIDQTNADGYYTGYGNELAASVSGNIITVGSGAFVVQGRMNEIEAGGESITLAIENGKVGYLCARIETYHPSDEENCTLVVKTAAALSDIVLTKQDTYGAGAETANRVYELPLYSFSMENNSITNVVKIIKPVADYATVKTVADNAMTTASTALSASSAANTKANDASATANKAKAQSETAESKADAAVAAANDALTRVVEAAGGTVIYKNGVAVAQIEIEVIAKTIMYAFGCQEAETARGYTIGGGIDRKFKELEKKIAEVSATNV